MRFFRAGVLLAVISGVVGGCAAVRELPPEQRKAEPGTAEYRLCRELLICFIKDDAAGFARRLSPEARENFPAGQFKATRSAMLKSLGEPVSFCYVTALEFVTFTPHIWKVRFRRVGSGGKKAVFREALFRIITGRSPDGQILVVGFNFL